jgi:hypothetical protein
LPTKFNMTKDVAGYNGFGVTPCLDSYTGLLAVGVADSVVTPSEYPAYIAVLSYTPGSNVFVDTVTTAAAPVGAIAASSACLNPSGLRVLKGTTISFITPDAAGAYVSVRFFVVPEFGN